LIKIIILEENFKWHLEAFASELFKYSCQVFMLCTACCTNTHPKNSFSMLVALS